MRRVFYPVGLCALIGVGAISWANPYSGMETQTLKALSAERIAGLRDGAGLGYAKTAELNGWPGPLHVFELAEPLDLSADQTAAIEAVRAAMLVEARSLGEAMIAAEQALEALFHDPSPTPDAVEALTLKIGEIEGALRAAHLNAHLAATPLLTAHQRRMYQHLRGYSGGHGAHSGHERGHQ